MVDIAQYTYTMINRNMLYTPLNWDRSVHISHEEDWDRSAFSGKLYFISSESQQRKTHWLENTTRPGYYVTGELFNTAPRRLQPFPQLKS